MPLVATRRAGPHRTQPPRRGRAGDRLVHDIVPTESLLEEAVRRAEALAQIAPLTYRLTTEQLRCEARQRTDGARRAHEQRILAAWQRDDARAAVAAYLDRLAERNRARP